MTLKLVDMKFNKQAQALTSLSEGTQQLVRNIIEEKNDTNIKTPGGSANKQAFYNHPDDRDPEMQGRKAGPRVTIHVYYMPSNFTEYKNYEVIDKEVGLLSGRRRLVMRTADDKTAFYTTSHPRQKDARLRTNEYTGYTPIDTTR